MRLGVIDLDTSHPETFLPLLRDRGHEVVALYGGTTVVDNAYTAHYAANHGVGHVAEDPAELVGIVDAVFIHSVNWDIHVERARPFAANGVPVHMCKPFAGRAADIRELIRWAEAGVRITGGSALRWSSTVASWHASGERAMTGLAVTYGHPLDYGIHAYCLIHALLGPGIDAARALDDKGRRVELRWRDGRTAVVVVASPGAGYGFYATLVTPNAVTHLESGGADLYERFLDATVAYLAGGHDQAISFAELVEPELAAIAAAASIHHGGTWVGVHDDPAIDIGSFDGAAFAAGYRNSRRQKLGLATREER